MAQPALIDGNTVAAEVVTEVRRKEALLKTGALQNAIFNSANFSSIATDEKGVIQLFNVGAERMLGYAAAEVVNKITPADISDPQEVIARAAALSAELGTDDHAGLRGAGLQGLARDRGHLRADLHPQGRQPLSGGRLGHGAARRAGRDHRLPADRHRQHRAQAGRRGAEEARSAPARPAVLYALAHRIQHRRADDHRSARHHHRRQQADGGADRLHARRVDRRAVQELLHRSGAGRGGDQAGAERKEGHRLRADGAAPGTARRPWCRTTRPPSTTATGSCRACSPPRATSPSASASSRRCRKRTSSWRAPSPRRRKPTSRSPISFPA